MPSMLTDLLDPAALPDRTGAVSLIQTHISAVFVADEFVYKIKKPVDFGFLDFTTLEKRLYYCRQEVELNRRLSEALYIDVLPVRFDGRRHAVGEGAGEVVDYAVKMKRIPEERLMISLFNKGALRERHLEELGRVLSAFHKKARRSPEIDGYGRPEVFKVNTDENFEQTRKYRGITIEHKGFESLLKWTDAFYEERGGLFMERIADGKIRDCHGDLHMEHICFDEPIAVFDCIEFNDRFRYSDTLADVAFLLMDLELRGGERLSAKLWDAYSDFAGESEQREMLAFYKVYRAYVRGKVNSFQLDDPHIGTEERNRAAESARRYFQLALTYIEN